MLMGNDNIMKEADAGILKGTQQDVACGVWFTSTGAIMPKLIKFQTKDGEIKTLYHIHVIHYEKKRFCGISAIEYNCDVIINGCNYPFKLIFYIEKCEWKLISLH